MLDSSVRQFLNIYLKLNDFIKKFKFKLDLIYALSGLLYENLQNFYGFNLKLIYLFSVVGSSFLKKKNKLQY